MGKSSLLLRFLLMIVAAMMSSGVLLLIGASKVDGKVRYTFVTITLLQECLKLTVFSLIVSFKQGVGGWKKLSAKDSLLYAVPGLLYMIDNNAQGVYLRYVSAMTASIVWNLKILTTAFMFRFCLRRMLTWRQWAAIWLLVVGVVVSQADHFRSVPTSAHLTGHHAPHGPGGTLSVGNTSSLFLASSGTTTSFWNYTSATTTTPITSYTSSDGPYAYFVGVVVLVGAVFISSSAGVYAEWVLKSRPFSAFYLQGVYLYFWGVVFNVTALLVFDYDVINQQGFFHDYNWWCPIIVLDSAGFGLSVSLIMKFLDNIASVYSHAIALLFTMCVSAVWFDFKPTFVFVMGLAVVILSIFLYHSVPAPTSTPTKEEATYHPVATTENDLGAVSPPSSDIPDDSGSELELMTV